MHPHVPVMPLMLLLLVLGTIAFVVVRRVTTAGKDGVRSSATLSADQRAQIDAALKAGHRVRAIKVFREATGVSLTEAVAAISAWQRRARAARA